MRVLLPRARDLTAVVCGGDRAAVEQVLAEPRLAPVAGLRAEPWLAVPDPRRAVLEQALRDGASARVELTEPC